MNNVQDKPSIKSHGSKIEKNQSGTKCQIIVACCQNNKNKLLYFSIESFKKIIMNNIESSIEIKAPISHVWKVLMNHRSYPTWNPFIKKIEGRTFEGEALRVELLTNKGKTMEFTPKVLKNEKEKEFRWLGHLFVKGLFDGEHYFQLQKISESSTLFIHGEIFSGVMRSLILSMIERDTLASFKLMNEALKQQTENSLK